MMRILVLIIIFSAAAAVSNLYGSWIEVSNKYVIIAADYDTARITMSEAVNGVFRPMLYQDLPLTTYTTVSINGQYVIYGSEPGYFRKRPYLSGGRIISEWVTQGVSVIQSIGIAAGRVSGLPDTMNLTYSFINNESKDMNVEIKIVLDPVLGNSEPMMFFVPDRGPVGTETQLLKDSMPPLWYAFDNTNSRALGAQETIAGSATSPAKIVFASWERFYENSWDFQIDSSRDFRRQGTVQYDSAVGIYYSPLLLVKDFTNSITMLYGIYSGTNAAAPAVALPSGPANIAAVPVVSPVIVTNVNMDSVTNVFTNAVTNFTSAPAVSGPAKEKESAAEKKLLGQIGVLDGLIEKVGMKYEILKEVYRNTYVTNSAFLREIDSDISNFEENLSDEQESLSNDIIFLKE